MYWNATIVSCRSSYKETLDSEKNIEIEKYDTMYILKIRIVTLFENNSHLF